MDTSAFKAYDIRGEYPKVVNEQLAFALSQALVKIYQPKKVVIAGDTRNSTPFLKKYLADGFPGGVQLFDIGEVPVPEFYFTAKSQGFDIGVMVTASHLKSSDNGFKLVKKNGSPLDQSEVKKLKTIIESKNYSQIVVPVRKIERLEETEKYVTALIKNSGLKKIDLSLALDTIKSSTSTVVPLLFKKLNARYQLTQGSHEGNPLVAENWAELSYLVKAKKADLGIIWDSDGDRVAFIDNSGKFIPVSFVLAILGSEEVKKQKDSIVAVDIRAGLVVRDEVEKNGGKVEVFPAWHQSLQFAMEENKTIVFAGENSGHIIFKDFYNLDDGLFAALKFIDYCQKNDLSSRLKGLEKRYFELPEQNFKCTHEDSIEILTRLTDEYRAKGDQVSLIDGLTVYGKDYKINLRLSATEPLLRLNLETRSASTSSQIVESIRNLLP